MMQGRVCIVTGASSGIGRGIAVALAGRGAKVVVVGRDAMRLEMALDAVRDAGGTGPDDHLAVAADVTSPGDMQRMAQTCERRFGRIDALIASAGIGRTPAAESRMPYSVRDLPLAEWQGVLDVNLNGVFLSNRAVLPIMIAQQSGTIVNICSSTTPRGLRGRPLAPAYSASKFAVSAFTEALASEAAEDGVRVFAVFPGPVETPLIANTMLDAPFGGRIDMSSFAATLAAMVSAEDELYLPSPHILPMPMRGGGRT